MRRWCVLGTVGCLLQMLAAPATPHHGAAGLFDESRAVELKGVVKTWSFVNPHPVLVLVVTDEGGNEADWDIYFGPSAATALRRRGYAPETFQYGEPLVVTGHPANAAGVRGVDVFGEGTSIVRADGTRVP